MPKQIRERSHFRDRGLNTISIWTRGSLTGGLVLTGVLGLGFAWAAPGSTSQSSPTAVPPPVVPSTPGTLRVNPNATTAPPATKKERHAPVQPALRPPAQPVLPTPLPARTRSGGS